MAAPAGLAPEAAGPRQAAPVCRHCGGPLLDARSRETGFCCAGCAYVFRLVEGQGLAAYYRIKDSVTIPADSAVFEPRDYGWLEALQRKAEEAALAQAVPAVSPAPRPAARRPELTLDLQGVSCAGCVWLIERLFQKEPGARAVFTNAQVGTIRIVWAAGEFSAAGFARKLQSFGYLVGPHDSRRSQSETRGLVMKIGLCAAFSLNIMLFTLPKYFGMTRAFPYAGLFEVLSLCFATLSVLVGGSYFIGRAWMAVRLGALHLDLPIAVGIVGAYLGSLYGWFTGRDRLVYFDFIGTFVVLMLIGRWAQVAAVERNRRRLLDAHPRPTAVRLPGGRELALQEIRHGRRFLAGPGQTVPVEARLVEGTGSFSLASISGEADPRVIRAGQPVPSGAVNVGNGDACLEALESWSESLLARLLEPGRRPGWRHALMERIVRGYLWGVFAVAAAAGMGWGIATGDLPRAWAVVMAVLVVSCPCAIGLALPLTDELATAFARRHGVFVRESDLWGRLGSVRKIAFDKTGTLTLETPRLLNPEALSLLSPEELSALLALVQGSRHPVSRCLLESALVLGAKDPLGGAVGETVGFGLELGPWTLGRPGWRSPAGPGGANEAGEGTDFARDGMLLARFRFADAVRPDTPGELGALQRRGLRIHILSGDDPVKVERLASELGLPEGRALGRLTPDEKADWLDRHGPGDALMLGDGANDSLAFDRALCRGTPIVHRGLLESKADFFYLGQGIGGIRALFSIDDARRRTQRWVIAFAVCYNLAAVTAAACGAMNPLLAAVVMPASSLLTLGIVALGMRRAGRIA